MWRQNKDATAFGEQVMAETNRPEVHLEVCSGFFRIPTEEMIYNITVLPSNESSATSGVLPIRLSAFRAIMRFEVTFLSTGLRAIIRRQSELQIPRCVVQRSHTAR